MSDLVCEYTDRKNIKHTVDHLTLPAEGEGCRQQLIQEILTALLGKDRTPPL